MSLITSVLVDVCALMCVSVSVWLCLRVYLCVCVFVICRCLIVRPFMCECLSVCVYACVCLSLCLSIRISVTCWLVLDDRLTWINLCKEISLLLIRSDVIPSHSTLFSTILLYLYLHYLCFSSCFHSVYYRPSLYPLWLIRPCPLSLSLFLKSIQSVPPN